jgi:hypothetical protein
MNESSGPDEHLRGSSKARQGGKRGLGAKSKVGGIAVLILAGVYSFAAPSLNARFGWNLPQIKTDSHGNVRLADSPQKSTDANRPDTKTASPSEFKVGQSKTDPQKKDSPSGARPPTAPTTKPGKSEPGAGPLASRMQPSSRNASDPARGPPITESAKAGTSAAAAGESTDDLLYGMLREVSRDRFISPAGLQYTPGSAEGHRLEHLRRHTKDDPGRPGSHGVFDGDMEGALKTIDRAYDRAKKGQRTTKKVDDGRTIYTVDMGQRVGFVGGRDGGRKRNPMARRVRLVLEGTQVITAYPL